MTNRPPYCKCAFTDPDGTFVPGEACAIHPDVKPQREARTSNERVDSTELYYAEMEAARNTSEDAYFRPRSDDDNAATRRTFRAGFERAFRSLWKPTPAETQSVVSKTVTDLRYHAPHVTQGGLVMDRAADQIEAMAAVGIRQEREIERLRAALERYGRHEHPNCYDLTLKEDGSFGPRNGCLCGFDAAKGEGSPVETTDWRSIARARGEVLDKLSYQIAALKKTELTPEEPSGPRGKPCTCPDTSAAACGVERGHKLGELWFCKRAQVKAK